MATLKTRSIPTFHAPKPGVAKPARMPALKLPTMKTGGSKPASVSLTRAASTVRAAPIRSAPYSTRIAYAASSSSPSALTGPATGFKKQRDQPL